MVLWFYVQEHPKAQPAVVLIFKRLRRRGHGSFDRLGEVRNRTCDPWFTNQDQWEVAVQLIRCKVTLIFTV